MKVLLMHPDRDFDAAPPVPAGSAQLAQDLELGVLLDAAAAGDRFLRDIVAAAFAGAWTNDAATVRHRQDVLKDCLADPDGIRRLYAIALEPFGRERGWEFGLYGHDASAKVSSAGRTLRSALDTLRRLRDGCAVLAPGFRSDGLRRFHATLQRELDDAWLTAAGTDLDNLTFRKGVLLSAQVGDGGKGVGTMLRKPQPRDLNWLDAMLSPGAPSHTYQLAPRDDAGAQAFAELRNQGLGLISDALYEAAGHVLGFLKALRAELAFYVACLNLHDRLAQVGEPVAFPVASDVKEGFSCRNLRDVCLALTMGRAVVGNDVDADGKPLVIVTGANRGGKSTFLRSLGLAQLMLQAGLFVTADAFTSSLRTGLFTHYRHAEDREMRSGKFDEELVRMSAIADAIRGGALVLFNESFAATHEREGAAIARQVVSALLDSGVGVVFVSHMYEFARAFLDDDRARFLRADRREDGSRSFRLRDARPLPESFGRDLYERIFRPAGTQAATMPGKDACEGPVSEARRVAGPG